MSMILCNLRLDLRRMIPSGYHETLKGGGRWAAGLT